MKPLPTPEVYLEEMQYLPWVETIAKVVSFALPRTREPGSRLIDLMCGPGYFLREMRKANPKAKLTGVDISGEYLWHAKSVVSRARLIQADVRTWKPDGIYDVVVCTGSLHHLTPAEQMDFVQLLKQLTALNGLCIIAEPTLPDFCDPKYSPKQCRQLAALQLGTHYLQEIITRNGSNAVIDAFVDVLQRDILQDGEYKLTIEKLIRLLRHKGFGIVEPLQIWGPHGSQEYGDYVVVAHH